MSGSAEVHLRPVTAELLEDGASLPWPAVLAHTLPAVSASTRILERGGFTWVGDVVDRGRCRDVLLHGCRMELGRERGRTSDAATRRHSQPWGRCAHGAGSRWKPGPITARRYN